MDKETEGISIKDIISKKRQKTKKVDSRLIVKAYNYAMETKKRSQANCILQNLLMLHIF